MISTTEKDYIEQDDKIRGQNYVCLSFISPEDTLQKKEHFFFEKFIETFSKQANEMMDNLEKQYPEKSDEFRSFKEIYEQYFNHENIHEVYKTFVSNSEEKLEREFYEKNDFNTSIRGIKIRGVYDTIQEAQHRSESLRKKENNKFSIYIAEVGCWCPWSPNPDDIKDQEFAETELNTLMKSYTENIEKSSEYYLSRKEDLKKRIENSKNNTIKKENSFDSIEDDEETKPTDEETKPTDEETKPTDEETKPTDEETDEETKPTDEETTK